MHGKRYLVAPSLLWQIAPGTTLTFRGEYSHDQRQPIAGLPYADGQVVPGLRYGVFLGEPGFATFTTEEFRGLLTLEHRWTDSSVTTVSAHGRYWTNEGAYVFIANDSFDPAARTVGRFVDVNRYDDHNYDVRVDQLFTWTLYQGRDAGGDGRDAGKAVAAPSASGTWGGFPTVKNQLLFTAEFERITNSDDRAYNALPALSVDNPRYTGFAPIDGPAFQLFDRGSAASYSFLALDRLSIGDVAYLSGGARVEQFYATQDAIYPPAQGTAAFRNDVDGPTVSPSAGLVVKPSRATALYFSYAESTNQYSNVFALTRDGSTIDPEHARAYEAGARWSCSAASCWRRRRSSRSPRTMSSPPTRRTRTSRSTPASSAAGASSSNSTASPSPADA